MMLRVSQAADTYLWPAKRRGLEDRQGAKKPALNTVDLRGAVIGLSHLVMLGQGGWRNFCVDLQDQVQL